MTSLAIVLAVLSLLILGYYVGWKVTRLNAEAEVRDEYIRIQSALLGSMVRSVQRGDDLAKFTKDLSSVTTPDGLNRMYEEALSGGKPKDS